MVYAEFSKKFNICIVVQVVRPADMDSGSFCEDNEDDGEEEEEEEEDRMIL